MVLSTWLSLEGTNNANIFVGVEQRRDDHAVSLKGSYGYERDLVTSGRLRIMVREPDKDVSTSHQPEHTFRTLQLVAPGEIVPLGISLAASSTLFRKGDELQLLVTGRFLEPRNPLFGHFPTNDEDKRRRRSVIH